MQPLIRDYVDFWILEIVLEHSPFLCYMCYDEQGMREQFYFAPRNYKQREIVKRLLRLFDAGVLIAETDYEKTIVVTREVILNSFRQLWEHDRLKAEDHGCFWERPDLVSFCLSDYGGQVWEDLAKPDWDRYVRRWGEGIEEDEATGKWRCGYYYQTRSRGLIEVYLEPLESSEEPIVPGTSRTSVLRPWEATYWKTFPEGFEFYCEATDDFGGYEPFGTFFDFFNQWYTVPHEFRT